MQSTLTSGYHRVISQIIQASNILTDEILKAIAPSLVNLEHLKLSGCYTSITHLGVSAIVSSSMNGILELALIKSLYYAFVSSPIHLGLISFGTWFLEHGRFREPMHFIWCT